MTTPRGPSLLRRYLRHGMLPQLATFETVLRLRSATRAAEAMCIAQPTLSGHLRKLSEALGVPLLKHQGKQLVPTDSALVLLQTCHEIFATFERCEVALAQRRPDVAASSANIGRIGLPRQCDRGIDTYKRANPATHGCAVRGPRREDHGWVRV